MERLRHMRCGILCLALVLGSAAWANWSETFDDNSFDLSTWQFYAYPQLTGTFTHTIQDRPDANDYLALAETTAPALGGSGFGIGFASNEPFADVRFGATVNVAGDASHSYHGLGARTTYVVDDGSASGAPGLLASAYIMLIHWQDGPANLRIEVFKIVNLADTVMKTYIEVPVPGLDHARHHYAEIEVVGSDPVYITGSLYESKGGPLLARTPTLIDTGGVDPWEKGGVHDAVYRQGVSAIFSMNRDGGRPGYYATFDDVSSASNGPSAVHPSPADGAVEISAESTLTWVEAAFATSRELWFGEDGNMQMIDPAPAGRNFDSGELAFNQRYQWRIDEIGPTGTVTGHTWAFTTGDFLSVDDFESYGSDAAIQSAWVHNIPGGFDYVFLETGTVYQGARAMRLAYQNQYEPYVTEATHAFDAPQDWTRRDVDTLSLAFRGEEENVEQPMYVTLTDAAGTSATVTHPVGYAVQTEYWRPWDIELAEFADAGVDLTAITSLAVGLGDGTPSAQPPDDIDAIRIDHIRLRAMAD
jgi:hypothetical protein